MFGKSFYRLPSRGRLLIYAAFLLAGVAGYLLWAPGTVVTDGRHDLGRNGIWLSHGYLGDDAWFVRNGKGGNMAAFRDPEQLRRTAELYRRQHIRDLFVHVCPAEFSGALPAVDHAQAERLLDVFGAPDFRVLPWVGGVSSDTARIDSPAWRKTFAGACRELLAAHPRFAGVHVNIEPCASGDPDFPALLGELRAALPPGKILSVAAYPPPTVWHRYPALHWEEAYYRQVAGHCDQMVVMLYDTGLHNRRLYQNLMRSWTQEVLTWSGPTAVLLGVPAYDDAGVGYHDPAVENLMVALPGVHSGLLGLARVPSNYQGVALYSEWTMDDTKWEAYRRNFVKAGTDGR